MSRLAIVATHPIQYQAPWFRELAARPGVEIEVLYGHHATGSEQASSGFGVEFEWDIPLLGGYPHRFLRNVALTPSVNTFGGVDTPEVGAILRENQYDAVLVSGWHTKSYLQAIRACWSARIPVMVRSDSHLHDARPLWKRLARAIPYRYFIQRMSACLAAGIWSRDYFLHHGAKADRVLIVPHAAAVPVSPTAPGLLRASGRARWHVPPDAVVFLLAGKLIPRKRPLDFVRALAIAHRSASHIFGLIVGDGPMLDETRQLAVSLNAPVHFAGFLNQREIGEAYAASDTLVLPSSQDTWGLVVNEAMAWGLPCIVSDLAGCGPDLIGPGDTGFIVPACNPEALAASMVLMSGDAGNRVAMSENARVRIAQHSVSSAADAMLRALNRVVAP